MSFSPSSQWHHFLISLVGHVVFLILITLFIGPSVHLTPYVPSKRSSSSFVKVDLVAMPKLTYQEMKQMNWQVPAVSEKKPETQKNSNLEQLIHQYGRAEVKGKKKSKQKSNESEDLNQLVALGNKIAKGKEVVGTSAGELQEKDQELFESYAQSMADSIRPHWILPPHLFQKGLSCKIRVYLSSSGEVFKFEFIERSGETEFDERALKALQTPPSFNPPPLPLRELARLGRFVLAFPL